MKAENNTTHYWSLNILLYSILFLFFFQLLVDFVEGIYAFGLMGTGIPVEIVSVLLLFSPIAMLFFRRGLPRWVIVILGELMVISRVIEPLLDTRGRMLVSGLGVACFMIVFPSLTWLQGRKKENSSGLITGIGLTIALVLAIFLRVIYSGVDSSTDGGLVWLGWILAFLGALLMLWLLLVNEPITTNKTNNSIKIGFGKVSAFVLGLMGVLIMLYFAFIAPNVIARWTEGNYVLIVFMVITVLGIFTFVLIKRPDWIASIGHTGIIIWNILFVLSLILTIYVHQINFPAEPNSYPIYAHQTSVWLYIPLIAMLLIFPIILIDFVLFYQELTEARPSYRSLGGGFSIAALFLLLMIFAQVFTTVYDYIPVVGPYFRDKFWLVYLIVGLTMSLPVFLVQKQKIDGTFIRNDLKVSSIYVTLVNLIALLIIIIVFTHTPQPDKTPHISSLKILTYNIQQGYSEDGLKNYQGQLSVIRGINPDLIGLQETDTNRIANGNTDLVRFFADRLNMYSYYGPKTVNGTFGIALLSRYPIQNPRTFYMYSEGEQTAAIKAQITVGSEVFNVFVTHLGNGGPIVQQQQVLDIIDGKRNVILIGDFNFRPDSQQYQLTTNILDDAWLVRWPGGFADQGIDPDDRIDHTFLSPGTTVEEAYYVPDPASDHPAMWTQITWR